MEIIRAAHSGFCFGVKNAVDTAYKLIRNSDGSRPIFTHGQLIHNRDVTDELASYGVRIMEDLSEVPENAILIVRSHGETEAFYREAEARGIELVDTTCPFVARIHRFVKEAHDSGTPVIIVGDASHPEVIGINGWCGDSAVIVATKADVDSVFGEQSFDVKVKPTPDNPALVVCQTTLREQALIDVEAALKENGVPFTVKNTICNATKDRQQAAEALSKTVDAMVVIGGKNSSNTKKLYDICKSNCAKSFFVENIPDLPLKLLENCTKIGVAAGASTPERIIEEVITNMSETITNEAMTMEEVMDQIDTRLPHPGEIVTGEVLQVADDVVIVNLNCKKDGILSKSEVTLEDGQTLSDVFNVGDEIKAKVIKTDDNDAGIMLSKKRLAVTEHWKEINDALESGQLINVKVVREVRGGVIAAYKEITGFIPLSQLSDKYIEDDQVGEFMNQEFDVKVTKVDSKRGRAVFSRRNVLKEEKSKLLDEVWEILHENDIVEGTVKRFTNYGAFVDLGGIDGLLHISEISWGKLTRPEEVLQKDQKINVKILSMNREKGKISLGLKQTMPEPWSVIDEKYHVDDIVKGKIVQLKEYGAFVELEPGLDGLVHISEVANKHVENINDELKVGQEVNTKILDIDVDRKRISLSIKQAPGNEAPVEEAPAEEAPAVEEVPVEAPVVEEAAPEVTEAPAE